MRDAHLGPGHVLVRRSLCEARGIDEDTIAFEAPLRTSTGRTPKGSDYLNARRLMQLLAWPRPAMQPDLAVVLVDADGDNQRRTRLVEATGSCLATIVIAVAKEEFEAWLIADAAALVRVLGIEIESMAKPEALAPRDAKARLRAWITASGMDPVRARRLIAESADLDVLNRRCRSFQRLMRDLKP